MAHEVNNSETCDDSDRHDKKIFLSPAYNTSSLRRGCSPPAVGGWVHGLRPSCSWGGGWSSLSPSVRLSSRSPPAAWKRNGDRFTIGCPQLPNSRNKHQRNHLTLTIADHRQSSKRGLWLSRAVFFLLAPQQRLRIFVVAAKITPRVLLGVRRGGEVTKLNIPSWPLWEHHFSCQGLDTSFNNLAAQNTVNLPAGIAGNWRTLIFSCRLLDFHFVNWAKTGFFCRNKQLAFLVEYGIYNFC